MGRGTRAALAAALTIACLGAWAVPAPAESPADFLYEPTTFTVVKLTLPPAEYQKLEDVNYDDYVKGTFEFAETNGAPAGVGPFSAPLEVEVGLKGSYSRRSINEKAGLKVKFGKGQSFYGLEKLTLNNMNQDPSMIHEVTAYDAFHRMGVPAPHVGYAYVVVNGKSYGLHLNIETQDKVSLEKQFGPFAPPQHLYEGEYGGDVTPTWVAGLERKEGDKGSRADLESLVAAVGASSPPSFSARVAPYANLEEMAKEMIVERFAGHWDSYTGGPNNYYLYSDAAGRFQLLPSGTDQTWQEDKHLGFEGSGGVLFNECIADTAGCRGTYLAAGHEALAELTVADLDRTARCAAAAVLPWRKYEQTASETQKLPNLNPGGPRTDVQDAEEEQEKTLEFIASRPTELAAYLKAPPPSKATSSQPCPPLRPIGGFPKPPAASAPTVAPAGSPSVAGPSVAAPAPQPAGASAVAFTRGGIRRDAIVLRVEAPSAGRIEASGTFESRKHPRVACRGAASAAAAGAVEVRCRTTRALRRRLRERGAFVRVEVEFAGAAGTDSVATSRLRLKRR